MEGVKKIFGWVLLAMAAYFLRTALPAPVGAWLLPAVLGGRGGWRSPAAQELRAGVRAAVAVLFLPPPSSSSRAPCRRVPGLASLRRGGDRSAGRPAVMDFGASWCLPCLELDKKTFSDPRVREALERRALFKADMTRSASAEVVALSDKYAILGVPTLIFLNAAGSEQADLRLVGFESADDFLKRLEKAP